MNVIFVNHASFASNSAVHVFHVANALSRLGVTCTVAVPADVHTVQDLGTPLFHACSYEQILRSPPRLAGPTLVHAWTPREIVRRCTEELSARLDCGYVVHMEDNEEHILERILGVPVAELLGRKDLEVPISLSHPVRYKQFIAGAAGVTALIDRLLEFKPDDVPGQVFWPAFDPGADWGRARDEALREKLGIGREEKVVVYTGNVHPANQKEVSSLYLAVALVRRRGVPLRLVRTGVDYARPHTTEYLDGIMKEIVIPLGIVPRAELPSVLSLADVLVQPGGPDPFNDFRFPSKLPEFLASGRPVLLPRSNIGRVLRDGVECILLEEGNALEIARKLEPLLGDAKRRERIGFAGREFALKNLSWPKAARDLLSFYERIAERPRRRDREHAQDTAMVR